jgi:hypothetical protein
MGHRRIHGDVPPAGRALKDADDSIFEDSPVLFFGLPKGLLSLLTFGNVLLDSDELRIGGFADALGLRA